MKRSVSGLRDQCKNAMLQMVRALLNLHLPILEKFSGAAAWATSIWRTIQRARVKAFQNNKHILHTFSAGFVQMQAE